MGPPSPSEDTNDVVETLQTLSGIHPEKQQDDAEMKEADNDADVDDADSPQKKSVKFEDECPKSSFVPKPLPAPEM